jgi:hypothetical protein
LDVAESSTTIASASEIWATRERKSEMSTQSDSPTPDEKPLVNVEGDAGNAQPATLSGREAYNIVADTVGGVNVRLSDNMLQLMLILSPVGAIVGAVYSPPEERVIGTVGGGLGMACIGVVLGLFGSGIYLMIFRAVRHVKGKHD